MRDIRFRALREDGFGMAIGNLLIDYYDKTFIESRKGVHLCTVKVDRETVGQFTGLQDKNGTDIYEGDILSDWVKTDEGKIQSFYPVFWNEFTASYHLDQSTKKDKSYSSELWQELNDYKYEITGNIHQKTRPCSS